MRYYKKLDGEYIELVGKGLGGVEVSESEYSQILAVIATKPSRTDTTDYRLKSDLTWEQYQIEPEPDEPTIEDKAEAYDILMGVSE